MCGHSAGLKLFIYLLTHQNGKLYFINTEQTPEHHEPFVTFFPYQISIIKPLLIPQTNFNLASNTAKISRSTVIQTKTPKPQNVESRNKFTSSPRPHFPEHLIGGDVLKLRKPLIIQCPRKKMCFKKENEISARNPFSLSKKSLRFSSSFFLDSYFPLS